MSAPAIVLVARGDDDSAVRTSLDVVIDHLHRLVRDDDDDMIFRAVVLDHEREVPRDHITGLARQAADSDGATGLKGVVHDKNLTLGELFNAIHRVDVATRCATHMGDSP